MMGSCCAPMKMNIDLPRESLGSIPNEHRTTRTNDRTKAKFFSSILFTTTITFIQLISIRLKYQKKKLNKERNKMESKIHLQQKMQKKNKRKHDSFQHTPTYIRLSSHFKIIRSNIALYTLVNRILSGHDLFFAGFESRVQHVPNKQAITKRAHERKTDGLR